MVSVKEGLKNFQSSKKNPAFFCLLYYCTIFALKRPFLSLEHKNIMNKPSSGLNIAWELHSCFSPTLIFQYNDKHESSVQFKRFFMLILTLKRLKQAILSRHGCQTSGLTGLSDYTFNVLNCLCN